MNGYIIFGGNAWSRNKEELFWFQGLLSQKDLILFATVLSIGQERLRILMLITTCLSR